jgi:Protein of unknown function (DUF3667)
MESTCINCGQTITDNFCGKCGQRGAVKRITFREGWNDFWARIYGFDGMFPRTLRDLTVRPGEVARTYISGNRARYYGPVGYFFLMITLFLLSMSLLGINLEDFIKSVRGYGFAPEIKKGGGQEEFMQNVFRFISDNIKMISFVMIPAQAFVAKYLFFRKSGLNFLEHTVLPFFVQGHLYWASIVSIVYLKFSHSFVLNFAVSLISFVYFPYAYTTMYTNQSKIKVFLKGLGVLVIGQLLLSLLALTILFIVIKVNPDLYEMIRPKNNR